MKIRFTFILLLFVQFLSAQTKPVLTVEKIMRDQRWIGTSPSNPFWSADGQFLFFNWNPDGAPSDSLYYISLADKTPQKATVAMQQTIPSYNSIVYNNPKTAYAYVKNGDIYYVDVKNKAHRITQTVDVETNPVFINDGSAIAYARGQNIYAWQVSTGSTTQLTNFIKSSAPKEAKQTPQELWLQQDALNTSQVLQDRKRLKEAAEDYNKNAKPKELKPIYTEDKTPVGIEVSPNGRFIAYQLWQRPTNVKATIVPDYVTETGFTTNIPTRTKVGVPAAGSELYIFDRQQDTVLLIKTDSLLGLTDKPDFIKDYSIGDTSKKKSDSRLTNIRGLVWNEDGTQLVADIRSADNKDRWIVLLNPTNGTLKTVDRQRDEAWVAGPGIYALPVWLTENVILYQSERSGYAHIYKADVSTGSKTQLTTGAFEANMQYLSKNKQYVYFTSNQLHPGDYQLYRVSVHGGAVEELSRMTGTNQFALSPNEKQVAILHSYFNQPWELYVQENKKGSKPNQITNKAQSDEFRAYPWREPEIVTFTARDGATVYARLYKPANVQSTKPAVIFVHGAGYLQNVHKGWSSYSREYMFHNLLADNGYTVLDIDYRGSAGYGRNWRTGIYRHMGGKDLTDQVDGAQYLVNQHGVDAKRIGIYGGSYGGFITLMAMFTQPDVFAAGAALRSVTDWAHYNHGYTSNILNEPFTDSIAYKKSSPIYYAEGLKGHLLMCHGMVDVNVHFQDIVRLTQRLIELGKENWELAVYPVEDHGFVEPSSWTDEYRRIFKLFETTLK